MFLAGKPLIGHGLPWLFALGILILGNIPSKKIVKVLAQKRSKNSEPL